MKTRSYNPKRRVASLSEEQRKLLAKRVIYLGSPYHKRAPGDYGLTPPSEPRPDTDLCDFVDAPKIFQRTHAQSLLQRGVSRGLVSIQQRGEFPQNIWSVADDGSPLEAQLDNEIKGTYHGYPMGERDPFRELVLAAWAKEPAEI